MNKRRHQRIEVQNLVANLSDGVDSFLGRINNISRSGILLDGTPQGLQGQGKELPITISAIDQDFKMQVEPKWVSEDESRKKTGCAIVNPPLAWTVFAMSCEPKGEDIWAATSHLPGY